MSVNGSKRYFRIGRKGKKLIVRFSRTILHPVRRRRIRRVLRHSLALPERVYAELRPKALEIVKSELQALSERVGDAPVRVTIRNQKSRWGSCSSRKTISIHARVALLPPELREYILVHELCHLIEPNHSARFWNMVGRNIPEYTERKRELQEVERKIFLKTYERRVE